MLGGSGSIFGRIAAEDITAKEARDAWVELERKRPAIAAALDAFTITDPNADH
jgi:hypothetical protein